MTTEINTLSDASIVTLGQMAEDFRERARIEGEGQFIAPSSAPVRLFASLTTDNDDGTYAGSCVRRFGGAWATTTPDLFSGVTLTEVNGTTGIASGSIVEIIPRLDESTKTAGYFFAWESFEIDYADVYPDLGFWARLTSRSSGATYNFTQLDIDATTENANTGTATEVNGHETIHTGSSDGIIVWVRPTAASPSSSDYVFEYAEHSWWGKVSAVASGATYNMDVLDDDGSDLAFNLTAAELNGITDVPIGSLVRVFSDRGDTYRFNFVRRSVWATVTAASSGGSHNVTLLENDGTTSTGSSVTAVEVNGYALPTSTVVRVFYELADTIYYRFEYTPNMLITVSLSSDGGSAGDASTQCSYTYTATDRYDGTTVHATTATPTASVRTTTGAFNAATYGMCELQADGTYSLFWANETPQVTTCS